MAAPVPAARRRQGGRITLLLLPWLPLLGCSDLQASPPPEPFGLQCTLADGRELRLRIDPRRQLVQQLDPASGALIDTVSTSEPPPAELGGGILDESEVRISAREIVWEERMYRPEYVRESQRVDLTSLRYTAESGGLGDAGADPVLSRQEGRCRRLAAGPQP
jgi:hypothetical protein